MDNFVGSLLPLYRFQGSNLGHQAWCRHLYPVSHLTNPVFGFIECWGQAPSVLPIESGLEPTKASVEVSSSTRE